MGVEWQTITIRLGDLIPWPRNPRQIKRAQMERLSRSFDEFGQVETIAIGPNGEIYNGHQRLAVLMQQHGPDYVLDARQADRPLTEKEREKLTIYLHKGAAGEWNFDTLANEFEVDELLDWGFERWELGLLGDEELTEKEGSIRPRQMFHVLISVGVNQASEIQEAVKTIARIPGVEISYGANG